MASPYDLTDLADLKSWLDVQSTEDDDLIGNLITQVSRAILTYCDRRSKCQGELSAFTPFGLLALFLRARNAKRVSRIAVKQQREVLTCCRKTLSASGIFHANHFCRGLDLQVLAFVALPLR